MAQPQVIEGTIEEISALLQGGAFAGRKARIIIEADKDEQDLTDDLPDPPNTISNAAQLEQLLLEGLSSPVHEVTEERWEEIQREIRRRHAARHSQ